MSVHRSRYSTKAARCHGEWLLDRAADGLPYPGDGAQVSRETIEQIKADEAAEHLAGEYAKHATPGDAERE